MQIPAEMNVGLDYGSPAECDVCGSRYGSTAGDFVARVLDGNDYYEMVSHRTNLVFNWMKEITHAVKFCQEV